MKIPEYLLILSFIVVIVFVGIRANHYFGTRKDEKHDSYLVVADKGCKNDKEVYEKCPRLEMWGFKMSCVLILLGFNLLLTLYLIYRTMINPLKRK